jgi:hypothetical protein
MRRLKSRWWGHSRLAESMVKDHDETSGAPSQTQHLSLFPRRLWQSFCYKYEDNIAFHFGVLIITPKKKSALNDLSSTTKIATVTSIWNPAEDPKKGSRMDGPSTGAQAAWRLSTQIMKGTKHDFSWDVRATPHNRWVTTPLPARAHDLHSGTSRDRLARTDIVHG